METYSHNLFRRFWALLLCVVMLLSVVPTTVFASDGNDQTTGTQSAVSTVSADPVYVLAGSDFQHQNVSGMKNTIRDILDGMGRTSFDGLLFCGDYSLGTMGDKTLTQNGYNELKDALSGYTFTNEFCIQGNHDVHFSNVDFLDATTYYSTENYDVYCLNWADYGSASSQAAVVAQANNLRNILSTKTVGDKPIFVISHAPLHHSYRSVHDGDTRYGSYLVDVLNEASHRGLNIIFLYGHNHSSGYDFYLGGTTNFVGKGDTLWVTDPENVNNPAIPRTINFTYMNAGYVGQTIVQGGLDSSNTMSVFEIVGDDVTIRRYDINGEHDLQSTPGIYWQYTTGVTDEIYGIEPDTKTKGTPVAVTANALELTVPETLSHGNFTVGTTAFISVKNPVAGVTYQWSVEPINGVDAAEITAVSGDSVMIGANTVGAVMLTVTGSDDSEAAVAIQVVNEAEDVVVESNGEYFFRLVNQFTEGKRYMLINRDTSGAGYYATTDGASTTVTSGEINVGSYRDGMPFVMYTYGASNQEISRPIWVYEGGRLRNYTRTRGISVASDGSVQLLKAEDAKTTDTWTLYDGLRADGKRMLFQDHYGKLSYVWQSGVDNRFHTNVYAYEETPLYAVASVPYKIGQTSVGAGADAFVNSYITKTWSNGRVEYVPITVGMLGGVDTGTAGIKRNITVNYNGKELCNDFILNVGVDRVVDVAAYTYYTLTNTITTGKTYLIVNRNREGAAYLMETQTGEGGAHAQRIVVSLDASGWPCVLPADVAFVDNFDKDFTLQEWYPRPDGRFYQDHAFNTAGSIYLKTNQTYLSGQLITGASDSTYNFINPQITASDSTRPGYHTVSGKVNGVNFFLEFKALDYKFDYEGKGTSYPDTFWAVRDYDRTLGQEVFAYEKITSTKAYCSALSLHGTVALNAAGTASTGTKVQITRDDGVVSFVDVTLDMLSGSYNVNQVGTYTDLTLTYKGKTIATDYSLTVMDPQNPQYPDPGCVAADKVKNTTEFDFDETGVSRIDLSVKGTPSTVPLDVLVILDTSSSMTHLIPGTNETRLEALQDALDNLIDDLAQPAADGSLPDIQLAITQFNNYNYFDNVNNLNPDRLPPDTGFPESSNGTIQDWTSIFEMQNFNTGSIRTYAGTNYDVAFQHAYEVLSKRKTEAPGRDQVVIFMTDGICLQYNFLANTHNPSDDEIWAKWLLGEMSEAEIAAYVPALARDWYNAEGKNWLAEAIKAPVGTKNYVVNKRVYEDTTMRHKIGGTYDPSYFQQVDGLGAKMYTIGFGLSTDGSATAEICRRILRKVATNEQMFYSVEQTEELHAAFRDIGLSVRNASSQAALYDTMGAKFDLQMGVVRDSNGNTLTRRPSITIKAYDVYKSSDVGKVIKGIEVTPDMVGQRYGTATILETVTFNDAGTEAYSDQKSGNIMINGIISAKYFEYNTNKEKDDPLGGIQIPDYETFRWNIGYITEQELVLSYYVKLENALGEDNRGVSGGTYETNENAYLEYLDVNGDFKSVELESPELTWAQSEFHYGFYLVDEQGKPILDKDGKFITVGSVTDQNLILNVNGGVTPKAPDGYKLVDPNASYTVHVNSGVAQNESQIAGVDPDNLTWNNGGYWDIGGSSGTTYVYYNNNSGKTNQDASRPTGNFNGTTAWFAVRISADPELVLDKYVEATSDPTKFILTLEAYCKNGSAGLDKNSILREVLSDYFVLDPDNANAVKVYAYAYKGTGNYNASDFVVSNTPLTSAQAKVALKKSAGSDHFDIIEISGIDHAQYYLRTVSNSHYGYKLVVKVNVKTRDGFWGGNNVPTNKATTAFYNPNKDGTEELVEKFPIPQVNVPVNVDVNVNDKTYYYGTDGKTGTDLNPTVTVNGTKVTINGDKLEPAQDWMDDFTNIKWNDDSNKPSTAVNGKNPDDYTFSVTVTPKTDGSKNNTASPDKPSNIVGTPVVPEGVTGKDTAHVYILVPELSFKDSTTVYNTPVNGYDFTGNDYVSTQWVDSEGKDLTKIPAVEGNKPKLDLSYTAEGGKPTFTTDTKVDVTVKVGNEDITNVVNFKWQDCNHNVSDIPDHKGNENHNEFWVHVLNIVPDTVVIDFGLDVVIDVLANDEVIKGKGYTMIGLSLSDGSNYDESSVEGTYGVLTMETVDGKQVVRYSLKDNGMEMKVQDTFMYYVESTEGTIVLSATVTVIPATTIYFEDDFGSVTYSTYEFYPDNKDKADAPVANQWIKDASDSATQHEDRPGVDAANLYGFDGSYTTCAQFSLNGSHKFTANQKKVNGETVVTYGTAEFDFQGTGFDIVSMTSNTTGFITVQVYELNEDGSYKTMKNGKPVAYKNKMVDTYYGYKLVDGVWTPVNNATDTDGTVDTNTLYQVPVMKVSGLPYGTYKAVITISYNTFFDHGQDITDANGNDVVGYDFYLDAIRIYDPANDGATDSTGTIQGAYKDDGEGWPEYFELRNLIIARGDLDYSNDGGATVVNGVVFIDNTGTTNEFDVADYRNFGPNNELYLAPGQSITFDLDAPDGHAAIHMAMKSVGNTAKVKLYTLENGKLVEFALKSGNNTVTEIATATDLYYDISGLDGKTVVILNSGEVSDAVLSITNVKITYESEHTDSLEQSYFAVNASKVMDVLKSLNETEKEPYQPTTDDGIVMKGASLSLEDEVLMNFYFQIGKDAAGNLLIDMSSVEEIGLLTFESMPTGEKATYGYADGIVKGCVNVAENIYMVQTTGIAAKNMGDDVYVRVYMRKTDGTYFYGSIMSYSPKTYAYNRLADENSNMHDLCVALLNYGAAAQVYFGYKTDDLMNAQLSPEQQQLNYDASLFTGSVDVAPNKASIFKQSKPSTGFSRAATSVSFDGAFSINFYFAPNVAVNGDLTFLYWTPSDYASATTLKPDNASGSVTMKDNGTGYYWAQISGIAAKEIDSTFYATVFYYDANNKPYCTGVIDYSISTYCLNKATQGNEFAALAQATAMYGYYAAQYFASIGGR